MKTEMTTLYRPVGPKELEEFNRNIVGTIEVIAEFHEEKAHDNK